MFGLSGKISLSFLSGCSQDGLPRIINIKEHSKQVYTTQWSEKWKKKCFSLRTQDHKYPRERSRVMAVCLVTSRIKTRVFIGSWSHMISGLCFSHTAAMLSPKGLKLLFSPTEIRSQTFQLEARGTKSIVYGQYGRRANKVYFFCIHNTLALRLY